MLVQGNKAMLIASVERKHYQSAVPYQRTQVHNTDPALTANAKILSETGVLGTFHTNSSLLENAYLNAYFETVMKMETSEWKVN